MSTLANNPTTNTGTSVAVSITVNNKPVVVTERAMTGLKILEAAIASGIEVGLSFQVAEIKGKHRVIIGHDEVVHVHPGSEFVATDDDDNS